MVTKFAARCIEISQKIHVRAGKVWRHCNGLPSAYTFYCGLDGVRHRLLRRVNLTHNLKKGFGIAKSLNHSRSFNRVGKMLAFVIRAYRKHFQVQCQLKLLFQCSCDIMTNSLRVWLSSCLKRHSSRYVAKEKTLTRGFVISSFSSERYSFLEGGT